MKAKNDKNQKTSINQDTQKKQDQPWIEKGFNTKFSHTFNTPEFQKPFFRNWMILLGIMAIAVAIGLGVYRDQKIAEIDAIVSQFMTERADAISNATEEEMGSLESYYQQTTSYIGTYVKMICFDITEAAAVIYDRKEAKVIYDPIQMVWLTRKNLVSYDDALIQYAIVMSEERRLSMTMEGYYSDGTYFMPEKLYAEGYSDQAGEAGQLIRTEEVSLYNFDTIDKEAYQYYPDTGTLFFAGIPTDSEILTYLHKCKATTTDSLTVKLPTSFEYQVHQRNLTIGEEGANLVFAYHYDFMHANMSLILIAVAMTLFVSLMVSVVYTYLWFIKKK